MHSVVDVEVRSREDRACLRLLNLRTSVLQLCQQGIAREVPVFGMIDGLRITGIVDELSLDPVSQPTIKTRQLLALTWSNRLSVCPSINLPF